MTDPLTQTLDDLVRMEIDLRLIAEAHADVLRPKQIHILYVAAAALTAAAERIAALEDIIYRYVDPDDMEPVERSIVDKIAAALRARAEEMDYE